MEATPATEFDGATPVTYSSFNPQLNVLLIYEDFEMGVQGKRAFDLIAKEAGGGAAARLTVWRFDFFHSLELTSAITGQVEEADLIIVAPRDPNHLPPEVKDWLETWPLHRRTATGAVVSVFHPEAGAASHTSDTALLLWRAAKRAGMDFFCHARSDGQTSTGTQRRNSAAGATTTQLPRGEHRQWGINE